MDKALVTQTQCAACGEAADFQFEHDEPLCGTCMIGSARRRGVRIGIIRGMMVASVILCGALVLLQAIVVPAAVPRPACGGALVDGAR